MPAKSSKKLLIQKITLSRVAGYNNTAARPEQIILAEKYIPCFY
jgi:hypothetical protein